MKPIYMLNGACVGQASDKKGGKSKWQYKGLVFIAIAASLPFPPMLTSVHPEKAD